MGKRSLPVDNWITITHRTLQRRLLVLTGPCEGAGSTTKENRIANFGGTVIGAKKHECTMETSLLFSTGDPNGDQKLTRLHLNLPILCDGSTAPSDHFDFYYTTIQSGIRDRTELGSPSRLLINEQSPILSISDLIGDRG
nr:unnamed protein product [Haemonchus contortus]